MNWFKKNWLHFAMVALLFIISLAYFSPVMDGQTINQTDVTNWMGANKEIQDHREFYGEEPLWSNNSFIGMSAENVSMEPKGNVIGYVMEAFRFWLPVPAGFLFLYFISFYIMMVCFKVKPWVAIIGAIAFGFSSYFIIILEAGHNTKALAIAFMPGVIGGAYQVLRGNFWLGIGISGLFMAMELASNHPQISYYLGILMGFVFFVEFIRVLGASFKEKVWSHIKKYVFGMAGLIVVYLLAVGVNYNRLSMVKEASEYTTRGPSDLTLNANLEVDESTEKAGLTKEYITQWSYGIDETFSMIVPNAKGGGTKSLAKDKELMKEIKKDKDLKLIKQNAGSVNLYWGDQPFTSGPVYFGIIAVFLALLSLVYVKSPWKWALLSAFVLTTMLSWGSNFIGLNDYINVQMMIIYVAIGMYFKNNIVKYICYGLAGVTLILTASQWGTGEIGLTDFFIDYVPMYNKFRAVTMILVVGALCVPTMAVLFLKELSTNKEDIVKRPIPLYVISGLTFITMLWMIVSPSTFVDLLSLAEVNNPNIPDEFLGELELFREGIFKSDAGRSIMLLLLSIVLILITVMVKKIKPVFILPIVGVLILADMAGVDKRYLNNDPDPKNKKVLEQWIGKDQKNFPLAAYPMDLEIMTREMMANPELATKIEKVEGEAKKSAKNLELGKVRRTQGNRLVTNDYTQNYIDAHKFAELNRNTNYRVLDLMGNFTSSSRASYFHKSFGGYHGAKPRRYQEMIDFHMSRTLSPEILNMTNVKYIVRQPSEQDRTGVQENTGALGNAWLIKSFNTVTTADEEIKSLGGIYEIEDLSGQNTIYFNGKASNKVEVMSSSLVEINQDTTKKGFALPFNRMLSPIKDEITVGSDSALADVVLPATYFQETGLTKMAPKHLRIKRISSFDPSREAIINEKFKENVSSETYTANGTVEMTSYKANEIKYEFNSSEKQFAVFSEMYYPIGWTATIDGETVPINQVNWLLRGLEIPSGKHEIIFNYDIPKYHSSGMLSGILGTLLVLLFIFGIIYSQVRKCKSEVDVNE